MGTADEMSRQILPGIGFGPLRFGMSPQEVRSVLGAPERMEPADEDGDTVFHYDSLGIDILAFDREEGFRLTSIELSPASRALMWDAHVFECSQAELSKLAGDQGYKLALVPRSTDLPQSLQRIGPLSIEFYFGLGDQVEAVSLGVVVTPDDHVAWPDRAE